MDQFAIPALQECREQVDKISSNKFVIFNFRNVSSATGEAISSLVELIDAVRKKQWALRCCSMSPEIRDRLMKASAIREPEISENLAVVADIVSKPEPRGEV